jgi:hypothetical protein
VEEHRQVEIGSIVGSLVQGSDVPVRHGNSWTRKDRVVLVIRTTQHNTTADHGAKAAYDNSIEEMIRGGVSAVSRGNRAGKW